jgi:hypothetical protein
MPVVYACICPIAAPPEGSRTAEALQRVIDELSAHEPEVIIFVAPGPAGASKIGIYSTESQLSAALAAEAKKGALPVERLIRWSGSGLVLPIDAQLRIATCAVDPRYHFDLGRTVARALEALGQRTALVCAVGLATTPGTRFDEHYRRAIAAWDVKALVQMDPSFRRRAGERAVAQTAVLMGALGGCRVQPRELAHEDGHIVTVVDVLGARRRPV